MPQLTGVRPLFSLRYAIIVLVRAHARMRPGAAHGYCVGLIVPAILARIVAVRSTWRGQVRYAVPSLAGVPSIATRLWSRKSPLYSLSPGKGCALRRHSRARGLGPGAFPRCECRRLLQQRIDHAGL